MANNGARRAWGNPDAMGGDDETESDIKKTNVASGTLPQVDASAAPGAEVSKEVVQDAVLYRLNRP